MIIGVEITRKELCSDTSSILYKPLVMYKNREFSNTQYDLVIIFYHQTIRQLGSDQNFFWSGHINLFRLSLLISTKRSITIKIDYLSRIEEV